MTDKVNTLFAEKYRPNSLGEFVGNDSLILKFKQYKLEKDIPHLLLYGGPGVGKTTLAKIIVKELGVDFLYINASDENNIDTVRYKIKSFASTVSLNDGIKIVILDEADFLSISAQAALRNLMETTSKYTRFILTANYINRISDPILSRCTPYEIFPPSKSQIAMRIHRILEIEKIKYKLEDLVPIVDAHFPDLRRILNEIQRCVINSELIIDTKHIVESNFKLKIVDILSNKKLSHKEKFSHIRKIILDNQIKEFTDLYTTLYENLDDIFNIKDEFNEKKADAIIIIAEQQYQDAFVVDKEITFMSCIVRLLSLL